MRKVESFLVIIIALINQSESIKVNVEGTVSLGKDVVDTLSQYIGYTSLSGRRSLISNTEDPIIQNVRTAVICRNLAFCEKLRNYVEEFLTVLAMSLRTVLNQMLNENFNDIIFEQQLKHYLDITRDILERANSKATKENEAHYWTNTIKKICARFHEMASLYLMEQLQGNTKDVEKRNELNRKLIIATVLVELKYQHKLCSEYYICIKSYAVTESLNRLLESFKTMHDDKVRQFIRYFYEALFDSTFYSHFSEKTAHELQVVLNDMAYSSEVPAKKLLLTVQKIVEARLEAIKLKTNIKMAHDALLVHVILSDMDHIYSVHKSDQFKSFFQQFYDWITLAGEVTMGRVMHETVKDIRDVLKTVPDDLLVKLINEVKVFLEITIEPENINS